MAKSTGGPPIPKEHGAWAVLYAPLLSAVLIVGRADSKLLLFLVAVTGVFLAHEPLARLARAGWPLAGERTRRWWAWAVLEGLLAGLAGGLLWLGHGSTLLPWIGAATAGLLADRRVTLTLSEAARRHLVRVGYDPHFGARPLKRAIRREVENPLGRMIVAGELSDGSTVRGDFDSERGLVFEVQAAAQPRGEDVEVGA